MIVGTTGHIDHGKTSLVRALTQVDTDRLKEEKARGISIDLGFAYLPLSGDEKDILGFVDVPGHEKFVHTMLAGAASIDFVMLVVAADDGIMPQTREHLAIVNLLGIRRGIAVITKSDLVEPDRLVEVETAISNELALTGLADIPVLAVSTVSGAGIDDLKALLEVQAHAFGERRTNGRFRLAVDRSFTLKGAGTVVTGTVLSGKAAIGDHLVISPSGKEARIRTIRAQNQPSEIAQAGDRCALNLAGDGISKEAIHRGDMLVLPSLHRPTDRIDALLQILSSEKSRSVSGSRFACIMPRRKSVPASCFCGMKSSSRAPKIGCNWCWIVLSRLQPETASSSAMCPHNAPLAADVFSICARRNASAAVRSAWHSLTPIPLTTR